MIECKICGFQGKRLTSHVTRKHGISVAAYRRCYGPVMCPEESKAQSARMAARNRTEKARAKSRQCAEALNEKYASDPEFKAKVDQAKRDGWTDEARERYGKVSSEARKKDWEDPVKRRRYSAAARRTMRRLWKEDRERLLASSLVNLESAALPEARAKQAASLSATMKRLWQDPEMQQKFAKRFGKRYKGTWMRSSWEIIAAKWLDFKGYTWEYEPRAFTLQDPDAPERTLTYIPDFWVEEWGSYVEIKPKRIYDRDIWRGRTKVLALRESGQPILILLDDEIRAMASVLS